MTERVVRGARVGPGEGEARWIGGECFTFKLRGTDSNGALTIVEDVVLVGYGPAPHIHLHESETDYVVAGEFTFTIGDQVLPAPAGTTISVPRGRRHTFRNVGTEPGRLLMMHWPAATFEGFVAEFGAPEPPAAPLGIDLVREAAARHGIIVPPDAEG